MTIDSLTQQQTEWDANQILHRFNLDRGMYGLNPEGREVVVDICVESAKKLANAFISLADGDPMRASQRYNELTINASEVPSIVNGVIGETIVEYSESYPEAGRVISNDPLKLTLLKAVTTDLTNQITKDMLRSHKDASSAVLKNDKASIDQYNESADLLKNYGIIIPDHPAFTENADNSDEFSSIIKSKPASSIPKVVLISAATATMTVGPTTAAAMASPNNPPTESAGQSSERIIDLTTARNMPGQVQQANQTDNNAATISTEESNNNSNQSNQSDVEVTPEPTETQTESTTPADPQSAESRTPDNQGEAEVAEDPTTTSTAEEVTPQPSASTATDTAVTEPSTTNSETDEASSQPSSENEQDQTTEEPATETELDLKPKNSKNNPPEQASTNTDISAVTVMNEEVSPIDTIETPEISRLEVSTVIEMGKRALSSGTLNTIDQNNPIFNPGDPDKPQRSTILPLNQEQIDRLQTHITVLESLSIGQAVMVDAAIHKVAESNTTLLTQEEQLDVADKFAKAIVGLDQTDSAYLSEIYTIAAQTSQSAEIEAWLENIAEKKYQRSLDESNSHIQLSGQAGASEGQASYGEINKKYINKMIEDRKQELNKDQREFLSKVTESVLRMGKKHNLSESEMMVIIGQAIIESGWGNSELSAKYNNIFGIKASEEWIKDGKPTVKMDTREHNYTTGADYITNATWRAYDSIDESIEDRIRLIGDAEHFREAREYCTESPRLFLLGIQNGVNKRCEVDRPHYLAYATDPHYTEVVLGIIESNNINNMINNGYITETTDLSITQAQDSSNSVDIDTSVTIPNLRSQELPDNYGDRKVNPQYVETLRKGESLYGPDDPCSKIDGNLRALCVAMKYQGIRYGTSDPTYAPKWEGHWSQNITSSGGHNPKNWILNYERNSSGDFLECSGFVAVAFAGAFNNPSVDNCSAGFLSDSEDWREINPKEVKPGDIVIASRVCGGNRGGHVAIVKSYDPKTGDLVTIESTASNTSEGFAKSGIVKTRKIGQDFFYAARYIGVGSDSWLHESTTA